MSREAHKIDIRGRMLEEAGGSDTTARIQHRGKIRKRKSSKMSGKGGRVTSRRREIDKNLLNFIAVERRDVNVQSAVL